MGGEEPAGYGLPAPQAHHTAGHSALAYPLVYGCFRRCKYPMVPLCPDFVIHALGVLESLAHTLLQESECFSAVTPPVCVVDRVALGMLPPR